MSKGSRIRSIPKISWEDWSLHELLENSNIDTNDNLINKLSGWVNRINDIRPHLNCSLCNEVMLPDLKYAKHFARYIVTMFGCKNGLPHDTNIYLNHCWGCENAVIDSRFNCIRFEDYYLCLNCGSGPQENFYDYEQNKQIQNIISYSQGDICPKCGTFDMQGTSDKYELICQNKSCLHRINLPASNKITGLKVDKKMRLEYIKHRIMINPNCKTSQPLSYKNQQGDFFTPPNMDDIPF